MEILTFDLVGKMAHFRKYYANNTAMSFTIPPRTALMGILASIMGLPRDSYYKDFSSDNLKFGIRILQPVKKSFHRLNMLMIKGEKDFQGRQGHTQTPFEVVTGLNIRTDEVRYRIYLTNSGAINPGIFQDCAAKLLSLNAVYAVTFGVANFTAQVINVRLIHSNDWAKLEFEKPGSVRVHSAIPSERVTGINPVLGKLNLEEELLPANFIENYKRELTSPMWRVLFSTDGKPMEIQAEGSFYELKYGAEQSEIITFLD